MWSPQLAPSRCDCIYVQNLVILNRGGGYVTFSACLRHHLCASQRPHAPLGDKIRTLRKQKKFSLDQLAELTESSKSYIWELENKDDPKPSAEKIGKIAAVLDVTTEFLLTESATTPDEEVLDEAFFRKYKNMSEPDKKKIRKILDAWEDE